MLVDFPAGKTFSEFDTSEQLKKDKREEYVDEEKFMLDPDIPVYNEKQELGYYSYLYDERRNSSAGQNTNSSAKSTSTNKECKL